MSCLFKFYPINAGFTQGNVPTCAMPNGPVVVNILSLGMSLPYGNPLRRPITGEHFVAKANSGVQICKERSSQACEWVQRQSSLVESIMSKAINPNHYIQNMESQSSTRGKILQHICHVSFFNQLDGMFLPIYNMSQAFRDLHLIYPNKDSSIFHAWP